jgi:hypothetical protein
MEKLATKVVDLLYGAMYKNMENISLPHPGSLTDIPEEIKRRIISENAERLKKFSTESQMYKKVSIELHMKHLSKAQLEVLINFHESEMGQSIDKAQIKIQNELNTKMLEFLGGRRNKSDSKSGMAMVRTIETIQNFNDPDL